MNDGTQPLGSIFVFRQKDNTVAASLLHSASRWRAIMPKGDEEEIAGRGEGTFRLVALLAPRALIDWPTLAPSLNRDQLS